MKAHSPDIGFQKEAMALSSVFPCAPAVGPGAANRLETGLLSGDFSGYPLATSNKPEGSQSGKKRAINAAARSSWTWRSFSACLTCSRVAWRKPSSLMASRLIFTFSSAPSRAAWARK